MRQMKFGPERGSLSALCFLAAFLMPSDVPAQTKPPVQGLIWKATYDGFTVYMVGSIHLGNKDFYPLPKVFDDAFDQATDLVEEVADLDMNSSANQALALQTVLYPASDSLKNHVSASTLQSLKKFAESKKLPYENLLMLRPWALAFTIPLLDQFAQKAAGDKSVGIDEYFSKKAKDVHKKVVGVETLSFQMKVISDLSAPVQDEWLAAVLKTMTKPTDPSDPAEIKKLEAFWIKGDGDSLNSMTEKSFAHFPPIYVQHLLYDRNQRMAETVERYVKYRKPCLLVVGAAHFVGPKGIVKILQNKGYTVTQLTQPSPIAPVIPADSAPKPQTTNR
jgi:uncharacterized protein YbaP (TraB family)